MSFVHLHSHTEYSLKDATNKIPDYVRRVKELGQNACAITDHGVMYGCISFYKECLARGIKPIIGCEVYVAPHSRLEKNKDEKYYHLILLAENNQGYQNLVKIVSQGFIDGFYYRPRIDDSVLEKYHEGIICLSACLAGEVARNIVSGQYDLARAAALRYQGIFGADNYFLEMQDHGIPDDRTLIQGVLRLHEETGIPMVATNDCHYTKEEDADAHDILLCMQGNHLITDTDRRRYPGRQFYVKSEEEMKDLFPFAPSALENTQKIADRCNVSFTFHEEKLPHYQVPEGYDSWTYLNKLCSDGLVRRYGENNDLARRARKQLDYELSVIHEMGFVDYFLIVWDFINFARTHGIAVGPGRGSAAGSLVSYTTGITDIDPLRFDLFFERFLNRERKSMPDIDVDIEYVRRQDVIDYVVDKYGKDCVTQIVTFGTLAAKNAIRSVGRALGIPYAEQDRIVKTIPSSPKITLDKALEESPDFRQMYEEDPKVKDLVDKAKALEGLPANTSTHASGVIIAQKPMTEFVPVSRNEPDGPLVTQYTMTVDEELGLLKMDFLGLRTLTVIKDAAMMAEENHGVRIDISKFTYDDPGVFEEMGSGHTEGIFQLESGGMKSFMKQLRPQSLEEVTAGISLYRPGPMQFIGDYIRGKENQASIHYITPELEHILKPTYGCIVYQEQVMQIVRDLAGFSLGEADNVRRAMAKKHMDEMVKIRDTFVHGREDPDHPDRSIPGCVKNGISEEAANKIFDQMLDFASYAFNKSHAACYAVVAYQTAYFKHYYPAEFMAALMTSFVDRTDKISQYISVCRDMGIEVLSPNVNTGTGKFSAADNKIRYGLYAVKGLGVPAVDAILLERMEKGPYVSLYNFIERMMKKEEGKVNKRAIENLIKAGALDGLAENRRQMMMAYPKIVDDISFSMKHSGKQEIEGQMNLFDIIPKEEKEAIRKQEQKKAEEEMPDVPEFDRSDLLQNEKEVLGIYVSGHPLDTDMEQMKKLVTAHSYDFRREEGQEDKDLILHDGQYVTIGGMVSEIKTITTKKGQLMGFLTIEDLAGSVEVTLFPRIFEKWRYLLEKDRKVYIYGKVSTKEDADSQLLAEELRGFDEMPIQVWIRFDHAGDYDGRTRDYIMDLPTDPEGEDRLILYLADQPRGKNIQVLRGRYRFRTNAELLADLKARFGENNVKTVEKLVEFGRKGY
jgi:DNA polymerase-3 subunit alpha